MRSFITRACVGAIAVLVFAPAARAGPPANDNRADAQTIETFPADLTGTLVGATVERLDPQVSECGPVASTVWYRIATAPDGTISIAVRGTAGVAPVVRVYSSGGSSLHEETCGSGDPAGLAGVSFETTRGANYLVLVGRKPASADGPYSLHADLKLPPEPPRNDKFAKAIRLRSLPAKVSGTTVGARSEESDPYGCGLAGATVWYRLRPPNDGLVVIRLHANGKLDAVVGVVSQTRSRLKPGACRPTDNRGDATVAFRGHRTTTYYVVVGQQEGSSPGTFTLSALAAAPPEQAPGRPLPAHAVQARLDGLTNVNDVWNKTMDPGTTYRIALSSKACPTLVLRRSDGTTLLTLSCNGYRTFTPGPDGGGKYLFEVVAAASDRSQPYRLQVGAAAADDIGIGEPIVNQTTRAGRLDPQGIDVVDVYHFDVQRTSDVKVSLGAGGATEFAVRLYAVDGSQLASGTKDLARRLAPGRYVVAVSARPGTPGGPYRLALLVRDLTSTSLGLVSRTVPPGSAVTLRPVVTTNPTGMIEIQIDRFDTLGGWQFVRLIRIPVGSSVTWVPPAEGRWRIRAGYLGSVTASPSRSDYAYLTVG